MDKKIFLNNKKQTLPYSLNALKVENFQGIKSLEIADLPCDAQWIFLVGENGFGKTSVLQALAKGLSGYDDKDFDNSFSFKKDYIKVIFNAHEKVVTQEVTPREAKVFDTVPVMGYGASRFRIAGIDGPPSKSDVESLFNANATLSNIEDEIILYYKHETQDKRFALIEKTLKRLIPILDKITQEDDENTANSTIFYYEKLEDGGSVPVKIAQLSTGYRSVIALVSDMLIRLEKRLAYIDYVKKATIDEKYITHFKRWLDKTTEVEGIVIIDEFDVHLHPKYQYELPKLLSDVFPKVQFIVSTHSPIPLLGAPKDSAVVLKVNRTTAEGITIERMDERIPFDHLQPNALLTSPIFGFADLFPRDTPSAEILAYDRWDDIQETFNLQKELEKLKEEGLL